LFLHENFTRKKSEKGPSVTATLITTIHVGTEQRTFGLMARTQVLAANPKCLPESADFTFVKPLSWSAKEVRHAWSLTLTHVREVDNRAGCGEEGKSK